MKTADKAANVPSWRKWLLEERQREASWILAVQKYRNPVLDLYFYMISELCEELFYITFMPFTSWAYGRRYTLDITMMIPLCIAGGNMLKNIFQIPRPFHADMYFPNGKQKQDHGLPSTHTIAQFVIPFYSFYYFYIERAHNIPEYAIGYWPMLFFIIGWSASVIASRIYLAYHNPMDVISGFVFGVGLLFSYIYYLRYMFESWLLLSGPHIFLATIAIGISFVLFHPTTDPPTPAIAESGLCLGTGFGVMCGFWISTNTAIRAYVPKAAFSVMEIFPALARSYGLFLFWRFIIGSLVVIVVRFGCKAIAKKALSYAQKPTPVMEGLGKFFNYFCISICATVLCPMLFSLVGLALDCDYRPINWELRP
jgi:sphingosine-1-phosphate phosphatase 2